MPNEEVPPYFYTVKEAASYLRLSTWSVYQLLDAQAIESQYQGRKRLVVFESLLAYAQSLPTTSPKATAS